MSKTYEHYRDDLKRQEQEREEQEEYDFNREYEDEKWYHEQMELLNDDDGISEIPSTEEDLFRQIQEDEINETE
jgi:type III secretory pathway component EscR